MTLRRRATALLVGLAIAGGVGCGGANPDACGQVQPCGGDLVGTWRFSSACATNPPVPGKLCDQAVVRYASYSASGTATYGAALDYSLDATESGTIEVSVPDSCLTTNGTTSSCDQMTPQVASDVNVRCADTDAGCVCTFVLLSRRVMETGTYTTSGSLLTQTPAGGAAGSVSYCVANDRLHVISLDPVMTTPTGQPVVVGDVVGVR